jgi:hypothetical protein
MPLPSVETDVRVDNLLSPSHGSADLDQHAYLDACYGAGFPADNKISLARATTVSIFHHYLRKILSSIRERMECAWKQISHLTIP